MIIGNIETILTSLLEKIGGKYLYPKGISAVSWFWMDDEGKLHTDNLKMYYTFLTFW